MKEIRNWLLFVAAGFLLTATVGAEPPKLERAFYQPSRPGGKNDFSIVLIDCGQKIVADHMLLLAPDGTATLIDCGLEVNALSTLLPALERHGVKRIRHLLLTHAHDDHIGGLIELLGHPGIAIDEIVWDVPDDKKQMDDSDANDNARGWSLLEQIRRAAKARGVPLRKPTEGEVLDFGSGAKGEVLFTAHPELKGINNKSIVIRLTYHQFSMLLTGDMCAEEEVALIGTGKNLRSDVLKTGHHGGAYGTGEGLLRAVAPKMAVSSMPQWLSEDSRGREVDERLGKHGIVHFRTWEFVPELIVTTDGKSFAVTSPFAVRKP